MGSNVRDVWPRTRQRLELAMLLDLRRPVSVLVRKDKPLRWELWSQHDTEEEAAGEVARRVVGRGITAWSWWGSTAQAKDMLEDPNLTGD